MLKLPIFDVVITDNVSGIYAISLVNEPATEVEWQTFGKEQRKEKFQIVNEEKHNFIAPIMIADTPIYRYDEDFGEYYIRFPKEAIEKMSRNMLRNGAQNNYDTEHNEIYLDFGAVEMQEVYIKNSEKGINPNGFEDLPDGTLMGVFHVNNIDVWEDIKKGKYHGISLAGWFDYKEAFKKATNADEQEVLELLSKIEDKIKNKSK